MAAENLIDPRSLAQLRDLRLLARRVVEGMLSGIHVSRQRGAGLEFNQYRAYEPGDDPSRIDWKLFARSDRYYVREAQRESQLTLWCLIDLSGSMGLESEQLAEWSKLRYAKALAASLGWLAMRQGDAFGLIGLASERLAYMPCRRGRRHFERYTVALDRLQAQGRWPGEHTLRSLWEPLRSPGLAILITDLFEDGGEITALAGKLAAAGKDVLVVQLLTQAEREFPWRGRMMFQDRETGETQLVDASAHREVYQALREQEFVAQRRSLAARDVVLLSTTIEAPMEPFLARCLDPRRVRAAS
ncbi:MAG: DUF58 domain-containing protein [Pseudomonadota bacterium]